MPTIALGENPFRTFAWKYRQQMWEAFTDEEKKYRPQPYQRAFHKEMQWSIKACGGGFGAAKTLTIVRDYCHEALIAPLRNKLGYAGSDGYNGRIAITGATYDSPQVAFNYLRENWQALGIIEDETLSMQKNRSWRMVSKTGVEVVTLSANDPMLFSARPYTIVHMTEAMQQPVTMLDAAIERVSRWNGPFVGMVYLEGTFEVDGYAWYPQLCREWTEPEKVPNDHNAKFYSFPSWLNRFAFPQGMNDPKIQAIKKHYKNEPNKFMERVGGKPPATSGELWGSTFDLAVHVGSEGTPAYDPRYPVDITFDPATARYAVLFVQWLDDQTCNVIDEIVLEHTDFHSVRDAILAKPWRDNIGLVTCDRAADQHHQGHDSTYDLWKAPMALGGMGMTPVFQYLFGDTGIQVVKTALKGEYYQLRINPRCVGLISDFRSERLNPKTGLLDMRLNRCKDDARKALSYYLAIKKGTGLEQRPRPTADGMTIQGRVRSGTLSPARMAQRERRIDQEMPR